MKEINCTRCNTIIDDMQVKVNLGISTSRKTELDQWEEIANTSINSNEILCMSCFDLFAENLSKSMAVGD